MSKPTKKPAKQFGCCSSFLIIAIVLGGLAYLFVPKGPPRLPGPPASVPSGPTSGPHVMAEVAAFLGSHPEFGTATGVQDVPDWAKGKRQRVTFGSGRNLLFYTKDGVVLTVYEDNASEGRKIVWGGYDRSE